MSHAVTIRTQVRDPVAIRAACARLKLAPPIHGECRLFDGTLATGWKVNLPDWQYPVVFKADGTAAYDNFQGRWGDPKELGRFTQAYAIAKATAEARAKGYRVAESPAPDGSIRLLVSLPG